jgi:hypothetical protein
MSKFKQTRKFGNTIYKFDSDYPAKEKAMRRVNALRRIGYGARTTKKDNTWIVWIGKERKN